jgi:hypothetical protein
MAFIAAFMAHAPDADPEDIALIETPTYKLYSVVVRDQAQAIEVASRLVEEKGVESFVLCPGFSHKDIAELSEKVGPGCGFSPSRGDAPSTRVAMQAMKREGWM